MSSNSEKVIQSYVSRVAISSDNKFIVSVQQDRTVRIWETATGKCLKVLEGHSDFVQALQFHQIDKFIVSGSDDKTVRIWETKTGKCLQILEGHSEYCCMELQFQQTINLSFLVRVIRPYEFGIYLH